MSEVEKMYELAGVEKVCKIHTIDWQSFKEYYYPPFTAEKQLELIKWFINFDYTHLRKLYGAKQNFAEVLSAIISYIWKSLTETERNEIRDILKG